MPRGDTARAFACSLFNRGERVAIVLIPRAADSARVKQRILPVEVATNNRLQAWLRYENAHKSCVFLGMNPIAGLARGRLKEDLAEVRRLYIDIDDDGPKRVAQLRRDVERGATPQPGHLIESSAGRYQAIWTAAEPLEERAAESTMRRLVKKYGADPAAVDVSRVLRWPGFRNHKRSSSDLVRVQSYPAAPAVRISEFRELPELEAAEAARPAWRRAEPRVAGRTQSEKDWAWVHARLRRGDDPATIENDLAARRSDKPKPAYYARLTVGKAVAQRVGRGHER